MWYVVSLGERGLEIVNFMTSHSYGPYFKGVKTLKFMLLGMSKKTDNFVNQLARVHD